MAKQKGPIYSNDDCGKAIVKGDVVTIAWRGKVQHDDLNGAAMQALDGIESIFPGAQQVKRSRKSETKKEKK